MSNLKTKVYEAIGEASMCWEPIPSGVFDSTQAKQVGDKLWEAIEAENQRLREALSFYANPETYKWRPDESGFKAVHTLISRDQGERARKALEGVVKLDNSK